MVRSIEISLEEATAAKRRRLGAFLSEFKAAANFYAQLLWRNTIELNSATRNLYRSNSLGCRQKEGALRFALLGIISCRKSAETRRIKPSCPNFHGGIRLPNTVCIIQRGKGSFDFVLKISCLSKGHPVVIPFKSHARLNYWLSKPGAKLLNGAIVSEKKAWIYVRVPDAEEKTQGETIGLDTGYRKLITDSNGNFHGSEMLNVYARVRRCKPRSNGKRRAIAARQNYINFVCRRLPWATTKTFVLEDLTGLKTGKGNRGKRNRKLLAPWSYRQVRTRLEQLAPENRVRLEFVNPYGTSRTCPACGLENAKNRVGEKFACLRCNYTADADYVGAQNILAETTRNCPEPTGPDAT